MAVDNLAPEAFLTGKVGHVWLPMVTRANKYGVKNLCLPLVIDAVEGAGVSKEV